MINLEYPEGATPIDPDEATGLLLTHITTREELDRWEQDNIYEALEWLEKTKPKDILNETFIRKLHKQMFGNVWKWAGMFRQSDKNIGGRWWQISADLKDLCDDTRLWVGSRNEPSDEIAVRFHHRLVLIHPFPRAVLGVVLRVAPTSGEGAVIFFHYHPSEVHHLEIEFYLLILEELLDL